MHEGWPALLVVHHDDEHQTWEFVNGGGDVSHQGVDDAMMVHVHHILDLDRSIERLSDLPLGWQAWRETPDDEWFRGPADPEPPN